MSLQNLMQTINTKMTTICHLIKKGNVRKYNYEDGEYGMFAMRYKMIGLKDDYSIDTIDTAKAIKAGISVVGSPAATIISKMLTGF